MNMTVEFRPAVPGDARDAVPLIYSSGPAAFDYVFAVPGRSSAPEFLARAFFDGRGEFGWRNHVVGVLGNEVVAAGAAWDGTSTLAFTHAAAVQILRGYGLAAAGVVTRGLRVESVVQPPNRRCWYVAHLGVRPDKRGHGIGEALIGHLLAHGQRKGHSRAALDVAVTNPRAQALYERLGFAVTGERVSRLSNSQAIVANHRRMVLRLAPGG